ncbi:MAG: FAD-binding oxidoreductase [Streptococcus orisratti]|uniref:FAD-binding oxidoreductase n=1 Tax=Streptococcus orisratti TaxID=114652 RepID=UPI002354D959|nr:FAD-binding oxidoreductase [Streptococcus orisratti]MCI7677406.1 FAD-binding oxidoreductase [Streptococcus orisratti]
MLVNNGLLWWYVWMLVAIYLATRPKWLDRLIGLPKIYMIHGILSLLAIILAFLHKENSPSYGLIKYTGDYAFIIFVALAAYSLIFMAGWLTSRVPLLENIKHWVENIFKHEISVWLHRLNVIATILIFIHIQLISYVVAIKPFMILFWLSSVFVFVSYLWDKLKPHSEGIQAELVRNQAIAPNIWESLIQLPENNKLRWRAGDFVFISFPQIKGMTEPHPFSIVNAPNKQNQIRLVIRGDGDFTRQLQTLPVPSAISVKGAYGMYQTIISDNNPRYLLLIGGGIGMVPLFSIIEANPNLQTQLFYNIHQGQEYIYPEQLENWKQKRSNFDFQLQIGRFKDEQVLHYLPEDLSQLVVLIGGPAKMGRHWQKLMLDTGVEASHIYYEEFSW